MFALNSIFYENNFVFSMFWIHMNILNFDSESQLLIFNDACVDTCLYDYTHFC